MAIVERDGVEALTMPRLAEEAGAAVGGLYRYFDSKDALLAGLQVRAADDLAAFLEERLRAEDEPLARIRVAFGTWAAWADRSPALYRLIDASLSDPEVVLADDDARRVDDAVRPILRRCAGLLDAAAQAKELAPGDAELRALALWAALRGVRHLRKRDRLLPASLHADRVGEAVLDGLLAGWSR
jgi:AcrR family transcriptional regulator